MPSKSRLQLPADDLSGVPLDESPARRTRLRRGGPRTPLPLLPLIAALAGVGVAAFVAVPAMALDCQRAATSSEKTICADPTALAADADLGKAFAALHASLDPKAKTQFGAAEVAWLALRDSNCADEKGPAQRAELRRSPACRKAARAAPTSTCNC